MGALRKELEPAKPTFAANPTQRQVSAADLFNRTATRFPKVMAHLGE
jgi:hypothetical protein